MTAPPHRAAVLAREHLEPSDARLVGVVGGGADLRDGLRATWPEAVVAELDLDAEGRLPPPALLAAHGRFDVVVDASRSSAVHRLRVLLPRVRRGGCLVLRRPAGGGARLERVLTGADRPEVVERLAGPVTVLPRWIVVVVAHDAATKLDDRTVGAYLDARGPAGGAVLATVPAQPWTTRGRVTGSDPDRAAALRTSYDGAALQLRAYDDAVLHRQSAVLHGSVALPDSFRRQHLSRSTNHDLVDAGPHAVVAPPVPQRRLVGTHLLLDNEWRGQFGHNLLEQVSKTWAWPVALEADPDVRVLVSERPHTRVASWELDLLEAAGVPRERVVVVDEPVVVERLLTATSAYALPDRVHPVLADVYGRTGEALAARAEPGRSRPARVFFNRRTSRRRSCRNAPEVEALFAEHGFAVLYPEDLPLAEQVALVRSADVVGGFTGSGLYHLGLVGRPTRVVAVGSAAYDAVVEPCLAALLGHDLDLTWCRAVAADGSDGAGFQDDFVLDHDHEGKHLREVLAGLG